MCAENRFEITESLYCEYTRIHAFFSVLKWGAFAMAKTTLFVGKHACDFNAYNSVVELNFRSKRKNYSLLLKRYLSPDG